MSPTSEPTSTARVTYLRVVATTKCPMSCTYCHMEGDPHRPGTAPALDRETLEALLRVGVRAGVRKLKFLGGEPFVRADLPEVIREVRRVGPAVDLSVITAGVTLPGMLEAALAAGLDRVNVSVHGFGLPAFMRRGGKLPMWHRRNEFLRQVLAAGRPLKLNYVLSGEDDVEDLGALLAEASAWPAVVNVLDDLSDPSASPGRVVETLIRLRGEPDDSVRVPDPDSLPTTHFLWLDGLRVEVKDSHLGAFAPYGACGPCAKRVQCREGIVALRLTHDGRLQPCMDRPDLSLDLVGALRAGGEDAAFEAWTHFTENV